MRAGPTRIELATFRVTGERSNQLSYGPSRLNPNKLLRQNQHHDKIILGMNNKDIARLLRSVAAAYEVKDDDRFRIAAYQRAAASIEHLSTEIKDLWDDQRLDEVPGVGKNLAEHLDELFRTGKVKHFTQLFKDLPPAMFAFLDVPGIGPKTAFKLSTTLGITNSKNAIARLKKAANEGKIAKIEGFGRQSEKAILESITKLSRPKQAARMLLPFASTLAGKIIGYMKETNAVERIDSLGSLRRQAATVGDLDFAVATKNPDDVISHFVKYPKIKKVIASGKNTVRVILETGQQLDLKTQSPAQYGSMLQHYTGSKQHNIHLREIAQKMGLSLSEYGIKDTKNSKLRTFQSEKDFYKALKMDWIPPELREDMGEIEAAQLGKLPKLVETENIKGDLHIHSDYPIEPSHDLGLSSMEEIIKKAITLGYEYIGFSEHNPSFSQHTPSKITSILKRKKEAIDKIKYSSKKSVLKSGINVLNGLEVDIRADGSLAIPNEAVSALDYIIASIHSRFDMSREKMTARILTGLDNPRVKILGHPTGRMLGQREGYEVDWDALFSFCLKKDIWLEVSSWPNRLDLPDVYVKEAVKKGVKIVINSDSHYAGDLDLMPYGVSVARRGWATKKDVINTLSFKNLNARMA